MGLFVSYTCNLTFKNAKALREVAGHMPVERLLLETDAPFLAPQEFRGKRNEPAYLVYLINEWSRILGLSNEDITRITTHNANALFKLGLEEVPTITYRIRDSLYLNITNRCTNVCDFCIRSTDEILKAVGDPTKYKEIVFCGYGEPTTRLDVVKAVAGELKKCGAVKIRLVTNGHGEIINSRPIVKELAGLVDTVSVSLNADAEASYNRICKPQYGPGTYKRVVDFIKECVKNKIETEITCLDNIGIDVKKCEAIAKELGTKFRLRSLGVVG
jgi:TatD DNase family protein